MFPDSGEIDEKRSNHWKLCVGGEEMGFPEGAVVGGPCVASEGKLFVVGFEAELRVAFEGELQSGFEVGDLEFWIVGLSAQTPENIFAMFVFDAFAAAGDSPQVIQRGFGPTENA